MSTVQKKRACPPSYSGVTGCAPNPKRLPQLQLRLTICVKCDELQQRSGAIHLCNVQDVPHLRKVGGDVLAPAEAEAGHPDIRLTFRFTGEPLHRGCSAAECLLQNATGRVRLVYVKLSWPPVSTVHDLDPQLLRVNIMLIQHCAHQGVNTCPTPLHTRTHICSRPWPSAWEDRCLVRVTLLAHPERPHDSGLSK